jgi:hypothetical protein
VSEEHLWERLDPAVVHIWNTLGYRSEKAPAGKIALEWEAPPEYTFFHGERRISAVPGALRAEAEVVHESRRAAFCAASLYDAEGTLLASARCTQIVRPRNA